MLKFINRILTKFDLKLVKLYRRKPYAPYPPNVEFAEKYDKMFLDAVAANARFREQLRG